MKPLLLIISLLTLPVEILAQHQEEYADVLNRFFEITGANETYDLLIEQMLDLARTENPDLSEKDALKILEKIDKSRAVYRKEILVPLYQKYLTIEDLEELVKFYQTPIGNKYAQIVPQLTLEANMAGIGWGKQLAKILEKEIGKMDR